VSVVLGIAHDRGGESRRCSRTGYLIFVEAEEAPDYPIRVSYLLQARSAYANERLPEVNPHPYFTPFKPVTTYLSPQQLHKNPKDTK
jgi:hypothetical protein